MRAPHFVPETMPVRRLLRHFQATHHHMAFPVDEHGTVTGMVTLENVLEPLVGSVEDEFDDELPDIVPAGSGQFLVSGGTPVQVIRRRFGLALEEEAADTLSGLLVSQTGRLPSVGDRIELPGATAEVVEVRGRRAAIIRLTLTQSFAHTE
jgi:CBS domain containing-hemolysin-like protein